MLPDDKCDDVTMQIHFTLIEAFCLENDILVVKVTSTGAKFVVEMTVYFNC